MNDQTPQAGPPISPDGRAWWNGHQWVPFPTDPTQRSTNRGIAVIMTVILLALIGVTAYGFQQKSNELDCANEQANRYEVGDYTQVDC